MVEQGRGGGDFRQFVSDRLEALGSGAVEGVDGGLELGFEDTLIHSAETPFSDPEGGGCDRREDGENGDDQPGAEAPMPGNALR